MSLHFAYPIAVAILAVWCLYVAVRGLVTWRQASPPPPPTLLHITCAWCGRDLGTRDGQGVSGESHGCCDACVERYFPEAALEPRSR